MEVYRSENLVVEIDNEPIGGYRAKGNALKIKHKDELVFSQWNADHCDELADLNRKILNILHQADIKNVLIVAKQTEHSFSYCVISYPTCSVFERFFGFLHFVFGGTRLSESQVQTTKTFWTESFQNYTADAGTFGDPAGLPDVFCAKRDMILKNQFVKSFEKEDTTLLVDSNPIRVKADDPHLLIIANRHEKSEEALVKQDADILKTAQSVFKQSEQKYESAIFMRRHGEKLQGQLHPHGHVYLSEKYPSSLAGRLNLLWSMVWRSRFTTAYLEMMRKAWG